MTEETIMDSRERVARLFHETYEELAPSFSYETRKASAVPWDDVPENNRRLMIATVERVLAALSPDERLIEARIDRAAAYAAKSAVNEVVSLLLSKGEDAALKRAEEIRARMNSQLEVALSTTNAERP